MGFISHRFAWFAAAGFQALARQNWRAAFALTCLCAGLSFAQTPVLVTTTVPAANVGQPYSASVLWGNSPTSFTVQGGPNGLATGQNTNRLDLFGTISQVGAYNLAVSGTNIGGTSAATSVLLEVTGVPTATNVTAVAASGDQTCAVIGGGVLCFGGNDFGQLGDGTTQARSLPVVAVASGSNATAVSMSPTHTCAVVDGGVQCWGRNDVGQLGNNTLIDSSVPVTAVPARSGATAVYVSLRSSCAVVQGGVKCWGRNNLGQLGDGTLIDRQVPVTTIAANSGATSVAVNGRYGCATVNGGLMCWGGSMPLSLGGGINYDFNVTPTPSYPNGFGPNMGISKIVTGRNSNQLRPDMCYLQVVDGSPRVRCFGVIAHSISGTGTGEQTFIDPMPPLVPGGLPTSSEGLTRLTTPPTAIPQANATDLDMDKETVGTRCAVVNGGIRCWSRVNTGWEFLPAQSGATAVVVGHRHVCAIVNGGLRCASIKQTCGEPGDSSFACTVFTTNNPVSFSRGQSGGGLWPLPMALSPTSAVVPPFPPAVGATGIALGTAHTCTIFAGNVLCWGANDSGQLGNGNNNSSLTPVLSGVPAGSVALASGDYHSCAVTSGGVRCWGWNDPTPQPVGCPPICNPPDPKPAPPKRGQLGNGTENSSNVPVVAIADGSGAFAVAGGGRHSCALVTGGAVRCWGSNDYGQLGDGTLVQQLAPVATVPAISGATAIAAGSEHTCAVVAGGVKCWGRGDVGGALGNASSANSATAVDAIPAGSGVTAIAAGDLHTCALFTSGTVKCWGDNRYGQVGDGTAALRNSPTAVSGIPSGATAISAGSQHSCAVVSSGVRCWGANDAGQLGNGSQLPALAPAQAIPANAGISSISSRAYATCAIASGGVVCWGANVRGQLGSLAGYQYLTADWVDSHLPPYPNPPTLTAQPSPSAGGTISIVLTPPSYSGGQPILDYTVRCGNVTVVSSSTTATLSGFTVGTSYTCIARTRTATGLSADSVPITVNASLNPQQINFAQPASPATAFSFVVSATGGASGNPVVFSSLTPSTCSATGVNGTTINVLGPGTCTIAANQAGNASFQNAAQVTRDVQIRPRLFVLKTGPGSGDAAASQTAFISCGGNCSSFANAGAAISLEIVAAPHSKFVGLTGANCAASAGVNTLCDFIMPPTDITVTLNFALTANLDGVNTPVEYDPASDGLILLRYLLGYRGSALLAGITSQRTAQDIETYLAARVAANDFDVDGDGATRATSDGAMILRRMLLRTETNPAVITVGKNSSVAQPLTDAQIVARIDQFLP